MDKSGRHKQGNKRIEKKTALRLGERQTLYARRETAFGWYLGTADGETEVLLPKKEVPKAGFSKDEALTVFLYLDSEDRPVATLTEPKLLLGRAAALSVKEVSRIGAFLDWGLEKDLLLPYREMRGTVDAGDELLVRLYLDKSGRLAASMKGLYPLLSTRVPYAAGDEVNARIYEFGHDFGTFAAVDDKYSAMIPKHEDTSYLRIGDVVSARVTNVKEDGKLDITLRDRAYLEIERDAEKIRALLSSYAGVLPFTEKASPEVIKRETGLSKNAFKRAIGHLYKEQEIDLSDGRIRKLGG